MKLNEHSAHVHAYKGTNCYFATCVCIVYKQRKSVLLCYLLYQIHFLYTRKANGMVVAK